MKKYFILLTIVSMFIGMAFSNTLLLYKNSENGYGLSILKSYVIPTLNKIQEKYSLVSVESTSLSLKGYDTVISCYYSSKMRNADEYLKKLSFFLMRGGKLFIINNIGASINASGKAVSLSKLNSVYNFLGISYKGLWKEEKMENVQYDPNYVAHKPKFGIRGVEQYYVFSKLVDVILKAKMGKYTYPLITLGPKGGLMLFNFAFDKNENLIVNMDKILSNLIIGNLKMQNKILVIGENKDVEMAFHYALIPFDVSDRVGEYVQRYMAVVEINGKIPLSDTLMKYISAGGVVMVVGNGSESVSVNGAMVDAGVFPVPTGLNIPIFLSFNVVKPYPGSKVWIRSSSGIPLSWSVSIGKGKLVYYPKGMMIKPLRGLFLQILLCNVEMSIQSIVNSFTVFIDDFPLPSYGVKREMITKEFGDITDGEYYYDVWWKDIKKIGKEFNLKFTAALVTSYNGANTWPYDFSEFLSTPYPMMEMMDIEKNHYEMCLHGYNHQSPISKNWKMQNLGSAYKALKDFVKIAINENYYPVSFVAPNNLIDESGLRALKSVFPSVKLVGTSYDGTGTFSEYNVIDSVMIFPRTTAGYYPVNRLLRSALSSVMNFGTYQYFFHPDDLFAKDRNPAHESWSQMKSSMKDFLQTMKVYYPWLGNHFGYEAAKVFKDYFSQVPTYMRDSDKITIRFPISVVLPRYFMLRSSKTLNIQGGKILYKYEKPNLYIIEMDSNVMTVQVF